MADKDRESRRKMPLPNWWLGIWGLAFLIWLVQFSVTYWNEFFPSLTQGNFEQTEMIPVSTQSYIRTSNPQSSVNIQNALSTLLNPSPSEIGRAIFQANCAVCHGELGEGGFGPNLTDAYWIHVPSEEQIKTIVSEGVSNKGMMAWKSVLSSVEIDLVVSHVLSLRGSSPPNAKAPQGKKRD